MNLEGNAKDKKMQSSKLGKPENALLILRNSSIDTFVHCKFRYFLKVEEGWQPRETNNNLTIGKAVHEALEVWALKKDETEAYKIALSLVGTNSELTDTTFALLEGYFHAYKKDYLETITTEPLLYVPLKHPSLPEGVWMRGEIDGILNMDGRYWNLERKTTGWTPGVFWRKYDYDRQTLGYHWMAEQKYGVRIEGTLVDALFKPNARRVNASYERRKITPRRKEVQNWYEDTVAIARDVLRCRSEEGGWYRSRECFSKYHMPCEFVDFCHNGGLMSVLESTHERQNGNVCNKRK